MKWNGVISEACQLHLCAKKRFDTSFEIQSFQEKQSECRSSTVNKNP